MSEQKKDTFFVYTKKDCGFCRRAIELIKDKGLHCIHMDMTENEELLKKIQEEVNWKTVPMIFKFSDRDQVFIGGFTDLSDFLETE
jgi:glutaredoxin 3